MPAFSGLYAPYWKDSARGVIAGLTRYVNKGHLARAVLEATAYQIREVVEAMQRDSGAALEVLRVDGGMVRNELLMQFQSDILDRPVVRPVVQETTALGASYAAGLAVGFFASPDELVASLGRRPALESHHGRCPARAPLSLLEKSGNPVVRLGRVKFTVISFQ